MVNIMNHGSCFPSACPDSFCGTMFRQLIHLLFGQNQSDQFCGQEDFHVYVVVVSLMFMITTYSVREQFLIH